MLFLDYPINLNSLDNLPMNHNVGGGDDNFGSENSVAAPTPATQSSDHPNLHHSTKLPALLPLSSLWESESWSSVIASQSDLFFHTHSSPERCTRPEISIRAPCIRSPKCLICNLEFRTKALKRNHDVLKHEGPQQCQKCAAVLKSKENLIRHTHTHSENSKWICEICNGIFKKNATLSMHLGSVHAMSKKAICRRAVLQRQVNREKITGRKPKSRQSFPKSKLHPCQLCKKKVSTKASLKRHHQIVHSNEHQFSCTYCLKKFSTSHNMGLHILKSHLVKNV